MPRTGTKKLVTPKLCEGSDVPAALDPLRRAEKGADASQKDGCEIDNAAMRPWRRCIRDRPGAALRPGRRSH